jgi:purine-nucleoside phosphorylase
LFLNESDISGDVADFASGAVARFAFDQGVAALSVLTVSQNTSTGEKIEEHERQSRMDAAARIIFETLALDMKNQIKEEEIK